MIRFTHMLDMDWMIPGVRATGHRVEFALVGIIQFNAGKVAHEHLYWDQATVLSQLGALIIRPQRLASEVLRNFGNPHGSRGSGRRPT